LHTSNVSSNMIDAPKSFDFVTLLVRLKVTSQACFVEPGARSEESMSSYRLEISRLISQGRMVEEYLRGVCL
jgi:hypothetical protein